MDVNRYWGLLNNWTPQDEEQRRDQLNAIQALMQIRELYRKEVMSDEEYERNVSLMNDEQKEQFEKDHISQSNYDTLMDGYTQTVDEVDAKYGISQERIVEEHGAEISRKREELKALQAYYRTRHDGVPNNIMNGVDFDNMTANDIIDYYERVHAALERQVEGRSFEDLVSLGREAIREEYRQQIRDRLNKKGISKDSGGNGEQKPPKEEIEKKISKFKEDADAIKEVIEKIRISLVLDDAINLDVTEAIKGLDTELNELSELGKSIIADIDEFKTQSEAPDFSMSVKEIENVIKGFKDRLKGLKTQQIEKYNARVELTNKKIQELKGLTDLEPEVAEMIANLTELSICDIAIRSFRDTRYLQQIDYNKLVEVNKLIAEIETKTGKKTPEPVVDGLEADISHIEGEIQRIESEITENMDEELVNRLKQDVQIVASNISDFRLKLEHNKDNITEEEYNQFKDRVDKAEERLNALSQKIGIKKEDEKEYDILLGEVKLLSDEVDRLFNDVETFFGHVDEEVVNVHFTSRLNILEGKVADIRQKIEDAHNNNKIDDNQYNSLMDKVQVMENKLNDSKNKLKDPGMILNADIFAILSADITELENKVNDLEEQLEKAPKKIKDKKLRKEIDKIFIYLEGEIKRLNETLERYKDKDPDKYNAEKERLDKIQDRVDKLGKKYRKKCPLLVRAVKEAKNFYKKHKKLALIIAGLAAVALVHATVGPVLIPAIMRGNMMIGDTIVGLSGFTDFVNNILGGAINAKCVNGYWYLANDMMITPSLASTSLLKGLAISGIGTTALVAPIILAIKELITKMNLKEKFRRQTEEEKAKKKEEKAKRKEEKNKKKKEGKTENNKNNKKASKKAIDDIAQLWIEYQKSGMDSIEEFCEKNELSEQERVVLEYYASRYQENIDKNSGRGGRR